jgi:ABC-type Fe3+/spermidine/putrescine transport system ATPase subunit
VAQFLGDANLIPSSSLEEATRHTLCVRPENVSIGVDNHGSPPEMRSLAGTVTKVTFKGSHIEARIQVSPALTLVAHAPASVLRDTKPGAPVFVSWSRTDETILEDGTP